MPRFEPATTRATNGCKYYWTIGLSVWSTTYEAKIIYKKYGHRGDETYVVGRRALIVQKYAVCIHCVCVRFNHCSYTCRELCSSTTEYLVPWKRTSGINGNTKLCAAAVHFIIYIYINLNICFDANPIIVKITITITVTKYCPFLALNFYSIEIKKKLLRAIISVYFLIFVISIARNIVDCAT